MTRSEVSPIFSFVQTKDRSVVEVVLFGWGSEARAEASAVMGISVRAVRHRERAALDALAHALDQRNLL
ncbi:MAG: hypothetical protein WBA18_11575 [Terracidiphilus sp.]